MPLQSDTLDTLRSAHSRLTQAALTRIDETLPWYREFSPAVRSALGLVVQSAVNSFIRWMTTPDSPVTSTDEIFANAPAELARSISLQQTLQLVRVTVEVVDTEADTLAAPGDERDFREAVLRYSRDVAFSAAEVYARSAELRGAWDARLEAFAVDALVRNEMDTAFHSRVAALGWTSTNPTLCVVGSMGPHLDDVRVGALRRTVRRSGLDALVGIHGDAVIVVLSGPGDLRQAADLLLEHFGSGPVIYSDISPNLYATSPSLCAALAALKAAPAWPGVPRPAESHDLLPERAMAADASARTALIERCLVPLHEAGGPLLATLSCFLEDGLSLEATARSLFVHPNTVRYRLRRITEITGWDPLDAREAFVLHCALIVGRLEKSEGRITLDL